MISPTVTLSENIRRVIPLALKMRRQRTIVAIEYSGEWLRLAQVEVSDKSKRLVKLVARPVVFQEEQSKALLDLVKEGMIPTNSVVIFSIPRNLVTVRNLQLPTIDPDELREMINLQAAKQTPYSKDQIISDYQVIKSSPEGYTDVMLVTTHRSVPYRCLKTLDDAQLKADGIQLSTHGVLNSYTIACGPTDEKSGPIALVDIDSSFADFMVILNGQISFTKALSIGPAKLDVGQEKENEKFLEEIQRAVDIYENEKVGQRIKKLVIAGAEIDLAHLIPSLNDKLRLPVERVSLIDQIPGVSEVVNLPKEQRASQSFAAVLGMALDPDGAGLDLTPQEFRTQRALENKGRAVMLMGILVVSILTALTALVSQNIYFKNQYIEELRKEVLKTEKEAIEVQALKKKLRIIRGATGLQNSSLEILSVLNRVVPTEIYLSGITFERGSKVVLKGVARRMSTVFEFLSILEKQPNFHHVKTRNVTKSGSRGKKREILFEITCPLTKNNEI
jgi:Tfp pilus assembly PilM family ATPase/Tfp pilus assembly protein PilN